MRILVTGGAGYVGSHASRILERAGHQVWVYDNLSQGHKAAVPGECLIVGTLSDRPKLEAALRGLKIEAVMHFAAFSLVGESVTNPAKYYQNNVIDTLSLLEAMRSTQVTKMVFSSTTATYGVPEHVPITEREPQKPINPYGFGKLVIERALSDYASAYGFSFAALRYFNAAGASPFGGLGEDHSPETHLIPLVMQVAMGQREAITVFGSDYPTSDGTCIRDYIHVDDLGEAHALALNQLQPGQGLFLNLGTGNGFSVQEVIDMCRKVTRQKITATEGERRAGDPPQLVADSSLAQKTLGWAPKYPDLQSIVETAWSWHSTHPAGYADR